MFEKLDHSWSHQQWVLTDDRVIEYVRRAGFYTHSQLRWVRRNWPLLTALIDRWRPKTSMFHLDMGDDSYTLGCGGASRPQGRWSSCDRVRWQRLAHWVCETAGSRTHGDDYEGWIFEAHVASTAFCPRSVDRFGGRAYIFHMLGTTIFLDYSTNWVPLRRFRYM